MNPRDAIYVLGHDDLKFALELVQLLKDAIEDLITATDPTGEDRQSSSAAEDLRDYASSLAEYRAKRDNERYPILVDMTPGPTADEIPW